MEWMSDPAAGSWLRERLSGNDDSMHVVVPRGFPAYARILHPAIVRSAPSTDAEVVNAEVVHEMATWTDAAAAFGTTLHPAAQWHRIVRTPAGDDWHTRTAPDGREFSAPVEGDLDPDLLAAVSTHLVDHTRTPEAGFAALWEGWGGVLGFLGELPSRSFLATSHDPHHQAMLDRSTRDPFNNVFRKPSWQEGILSREISEGPRLTLPHRDHVLFSASPRAFTHSDWVTQVPWSERAPEELGFSATAQSPSILWPEDHSWVLVTEVDFDSTIVAGSAALIAAICADERIEAFEIPEDTDLRWEADEVNR